MNIMKSSLNSGANETLCMRIKCCFGLDYADEKQTEWKSL